MNFYYFIRPLLFRLNPGAAHKIALKLASFVDSFPPLKSSISRSCKKSYDNIITDICKLSFSSPVGLAAGLDKDAVALRFWEAIGFGSIETGTITYHSQESLYKQTLLRIEEDETLINRMGFPNEGAQRIANKLNKKRESLNIPLGINIGKSRNAPIEQATEDYVKSFHLLYSYADYFTINVSSPNTENLRKLQNPSKLKSLLKALQRENKSLADKFGHPTKPLFLKIAPDLHLDELHQIIAVVLQESISGIIASNTSATGPELVEKYFEGGVSGKLLRKKSLNIVKEIYKQTRGSIIIVGCGGIYTANDVYDYIRAGASLVQLYTSLVYRGPLLISQINSELSSLIEENNFNNIREVVGIDAN